MAGCERLDCDGELGNVEGTEHWLIDDDTARQLEKPGELRARRQAGGEQTAMLFIYSRSFIYTQSSLFVRKIMGQLYLMRQCLKLT